MKKITLAIFVALVSIAFVAPVFANEAKATPTPAAHADDHGHEHAEDHAKGH